MQAPALLPAKINDEQTFLNEAEDYFSFWRKILKKGYQAFGTSLDREWVNTTLLYCNRGTKAIDQHATDEALVYARQLNACIRLGQAKGVFTPLFCPLEPTKLLTSTS